VNTQRRRSEYTHTCASGPQAYQRAHGRHLESNPQALCTQGNHQESAPTPFPEVWGSCAEILGSLADIPGYGVEIYGSFAERLGFFADNSLQRVDTSPHGGHHVSAQLLRSVAGTYLGLQHTASHRNTLQHCAKHCVSTQFHVAVILSQLLRYVAGTYLEHILWCFLIYICDMIIHSEETHSRTHTCDMKRRSHLIIRDVWQMKHALIHICDMARTHSCVWHDTCPAKTSTHMYDMKTKNILRRFFFSLVLNL